MRMQLELRVENGPEIGGSRATSSGRELEGYKTVELDVFSFVHHAHATTAEFLNDAVMRDDLADHGIGSW